MTQVRPMPAMPTMPNLIPIQVDDDDIEDGDEKHLLSILGMYIAPVSLFTNYISEVKLKSVQQNKDNKRKNVQNRDILVCELYT